MSNLKVHFSSDRHDWETPPEIFLPLRDEFQFTLDVCASPTNAKVSRYFTEEDDGLTQDWSNDVCWMNPPYGRELKLWVEKARHEAERGATVVAIIPARTDTAYFHDHIFGHAEIRFLRGRVKFLLHGEVIGSSPFPSAIIWSNKL